MSSSHTPALTNPEDSPSLAPPPSYETHIAELAAEDQVSLADLQASEIAKDPYFADLSLIPTSHSAFDGYNSGITTSITSSSAGPSTVSHSHSFHEPEQDAGIDSLPPPAYSEVGGSYQNVEIDQNGFQSKARILG